MPTENPAGRQGGREELARTKHPDTPLTVAFGRREPVNPKAAKLWSAVRSHTELISFPHFAEFVYRALGTGAPALTGDEKARIAQLDPATEMSINRFQSACEGPAAYGFIPGADLYAVLKLAAEIFLLTRCGVCPPRTVSSPTGEADDGTTTFDPPDAVVGVDELADKLSQFLGGDRSSYIRNIIRNVFDPAGLALSPFSPLSIGFGPCLIELIWSYWHEEGMQVQTTSAIARRFQNVLGGNGRDPLAEFELDPLRPLSGFLWGYIQDEPFRLTVMRRAYEYQHHYGLSLYGKAVSRLRAADVRSKFLRAFHDVLRITDQYYRESADNTVTPDAFPLLIALRDLHLVLAEGAHNQFRDLPWTARVEMLVQQWLLARDETRDFLRGRWMVPYSERWMGAVDAMKRLQGWTDTSVIHFHDLAVFGERLLLSVRHVAWDTITDPAAAEDWALVWRPEVQGYIHAYRIATGVSLSDDVVEVSSVGDRRYAQPSQHLRNQMLEQKRTQSLPEGDARARFQLGALSRPATPER